MITATIHTEQSNYVFHELGCPYNGNTVCTASVSSMPLDTVKKSSIAAIQKTTIIARYFSLRFCDLPAKNLSRIFRRRRE